MRERDARALGALLMRKRAELVACTDEEDLWDLANTSRVCAAGEEDADQPMLSKSELAAQRIAAMRQGAAAKHRAIPGRGGERGGRLDEAELVDPSEAVGHPHPVGHFERCTGAHVAGAALALSLIGASVWLVLGQDESPPRIMVRNVVKRIYVSQPDAVDADAAAAPLSPPPPPPPPPPRPHSRIHFPQKPPSPSAPPPMPPSIPGPSPPPSGAVARLNEMFRSGKATNSLSGVGIIVHGFDAMEDPERPWRPCPPDGGGCATLRDRLSTSIVNGGMHQDDFSLPLFACDNGGLIMRGESSRLLCSFPGDGGTRGVVCNGETGCVPGCVMPGSPWCGHADGTGWCDGKPWPPSKLSTMLGLFMQKPGAYNEVVLDARTWGRNLPHSVFAIFYPEHASAEGQYFARHAHKMMLQEYSHLTEDDIPLVVLRLNDWENPFGVAPAGENYDTYDDAGFGATSDG